MNLHHIARTCHEVNRAICEAFGDRSQKSWDEAEQWQRDSAIAGVRYAYNNPDAPPSAQHEAWMRDKAADGWVYGPVKDADAKTHPCMVPYDQLPPEQRVKDYTFKAIVNAAHANACGGILMGPQNPSGWTLESLLSSLTGEVEQKSRKIQDDARPVARHVLRNNQQIVGLLMQAEALQRDSYDRLNAMAPNDGPLGKPRIGAGSEG